MSEWREIAYKHYAMVSATGQIIAEVRGTYLSGTYEYRGARYIDLASAMKAAEADIEQEAGR